MLETRQRMHIGQAPRRMRAPTLIQVGDQSAIRVVETRPSSFHKCIPTQATTTPSQRCSAMATSIAGPHRHRIQSHPLQHGPRAGLGRHNKVRRAMARQQTWRIVSRVGVRKASTCRFRQRTGMASSVAMLITLRPTCRKARIVEEERRQHEAGLRSEMLRSEYPHPMHLWVHLLPYPSRNPCRSHSHIRYPLLLPDRHQMPTFLLPMLGHQVQLSAQLRGPTLSRIHTGSLRIQKRRPLAVQRKPQSDLSQRESHQCLRMGRRKLKSSPMRRDRSTRLSQKRPPMATRWTLTQVHHLCPGQ